MLNKIGFVWSKFFLYIYITQLKIKIMSKLTLEDLKVIRIALTQAPMSNQLLDTLMNVDSELFKHGLKCEPVSKPRRPYQRHPEIEYVFVKV